MFECRQPETKQILKIEDLTIVERFVKPRGKAAPNGDHVHLPPG